MKSNTSTTTTTNNNNNNNNINGKHGHVSDDDYAKVLNLWDTIWCVQKRHELLAKSKCVHIYTIANGNHGGVGSSRIPSYSTVNSPIKSTTTTTNKQSANNNLITTCSQQHLTAQTNGGGGGGNSRYPNGNSGNNNFRHLNQNSNCQQYHHQNYNNNNNNLHHHHHHHHHHRHNSNCRRHSQNHAQQQLSRSYQSTCNLNHLKQLTTSTNMNTMTTPPTTPINMHNFTSPYGSPNRLQVTFNCDNKYSISNGQASEATPTTKATTLNSSHTRVHPHLTSAHHNQHHHHHHHHNTEDSPLNGHGYQPTMNGSSSSSSSCCNITSNSNSRQFASSTTPETQQQNGLRHFHRQRSLTSLCSNMSCGSSPGSPCNCKLLSFGPSGLATGTACALNSSCCATTSSGGGGGSSSKSAAPVKQEQIVYTKETFYSSFDPNQADVPRFELTETEKFVLSLCLSLIGRERNHILANRLDASEIHQHFINPNLMRDFDNFVGHAYEVYHYLNTDCNLQLLVKGASELSGGAASDLSPICSSSNPLHGLDDDEFGCDQENSADTYDFLKDYLIISPTSYNISSLIDERN